MTADLDGIRERLAADLAAYDENGFIGDNACMTDRERLLGIVDRLEVLARNLDRLAPGDQHYAGLIRAAITGGGE